MVAGIVGCDHDPRDPRRSDRVGARGRLALVTAGLERHVDGRARQVPVAGRLDCLDFGVRAAERLVVALADDLRIERDHGADERIGADPSSSLLGQLDRPREVPAIDVALGGHDVLWRIGPTPSGCLGDPYGAAVDGEHLPPLSR